jgi:hypothetical protein
MQDDQHGLKASTQATAGLRGGAVRATGERTSSQALRENRLW